MIYAGFFRRALALIVDTLIVMVPTLFIFGPVVAAQLVALGGADVNSLSTAQASLLGGTIFSWQLVFFALMWLYFAFFESGAKQSTWGKRLLGIKVVGAHGERISFARATGRFFAKFLSYIIFYIGFIMAAFTSQKRALHDVIAETYVVKKSYEEGQELPPTTPHILWLVIVCVLWMLLLFGGLLVSLRLSVTPTQLVAEQAVQRMTQLAQNGTRLIEPLRAEGMTLFYTPEGYRAVVTDPVSTRKFTLFMQNGATQVCCQAFPFGDCAATGVPACE